MSRKGRELEKLVATLEKELSGEDIEIKSPDYYIDKITGEEREIDVSIKGKIGTHKIYIILEVRDRKKRQDVTWIEQIATKRDDVGANRAVAISSAGFTSGAKAKANAYNIELRTLEEINSETIKNWLLIDHMDYSSRVYNILKLNFNNESIDDNDAKRIIDFFKSYGDSFPAHLKFIQINKTTESKSLHELFLSINQNEIYKDVHFGGKQITKKINILPEDQDFGFQIDPQDDLEPIKIVYIEATIELWIEQKKLDIKSIKEYRNSEQTYAHVIKFEDVEIFKKRKSIELHRIPDGEQYKIIFKINREDE